MAKYKRTKKGAGRTVKHYNFGIDVDLLSVLEGVENKTRLVNDAIRAYVGKVKNPK